MRKLLIALWISFLPLAGAVHANEGLFKKNACVACHSADKKLVGPSYKDVAAKYKADKEAEARLIKKVTEGGRGEWGNIIMPPRGGKKDVPDDDIKAMVKYILSL